jgi:ketosteroid isomerase-like protein
MLCSLPDRAEIDDVIARYAFAIDGRQWNDLGDVFASDAIMDFSVSTGVIHEGVEQIIEFVRNAVGSLAATQHLMLTSQVWSTGPDTAEGRTHGTAHHVAAGAALPAGPDQVFTVSYTYTDKFRRTSDGWRIEYRFLTLLTAYGDPSIVTVR